jgi:hypothetical protein
MADLLTTLMAAAAVVGVAVFFFGITFGRLLDLLFGQPRQGGSYSEKRETRARKIARAMIMAAFGIAFILIGRAL